MTVGTGHSIREPPISPNNSKRLVNIIVFLINILCTLIHKQLRKGCHATRCFHPSHTRRVRFRGLCPRFMIRCDFSALSGPLSEGEKRGGGGRRGMLRIALPSFLFLPFLGMSCLYENQNTLSAEKKTWWCESSMGPLLLSSGSVGLVGRDRGLCTFMRRCTLPHLSCLQFSIFLLFAGGGHVRLCKARELIPHTQRPCLSRLWKKVVRG